MTLQFHSFVIYHSTSYNKSKGIWVITNVLNDFIYNIKSCSIIIYMVLLFSFLILIIIHPIRLLKLRWKMTVNRICLLQLLKDYITTGVRLLFSLEKKLLMTSICSLWREGIVYRRAHHYLFCTGIVIQRSMNNDLH